MKQAKTEMIKAGATEQEADRAIALFELLRPGLKVKRNGRVATEYGDKTPYGLYLTIKTFFEETSAPELLGALKEIVSQIDQGGSGGKVFSRDYCITAARAAITKAEGKPCS